MASATLIPICYVSQHIHRLQSLDKIVEASLYLAQ